MQLPPAFAGVIKALYNGSTAIRLGVLGPEFLYDFASGVLQGCPLSGLLFVWCMDLFIRMMMKRVESQGRGVLKICADDVGAALKTIWSLVVLAEIFVVDEAVFGLALNVNQRIIVPTATTWTIDLLHRIRSWLQVNLTTWAGFRVAPLAKYLGFFLGPAADLHAWDGPLLKWEARIRTIAASAAAPSVGTTLMATRATPCLGHVAQLMPLPKTSWRREMWAAASV
jgi:hypothetical protein